MPAGLVLGPVGELHLAQRAVSHLDRPASRAQRSAFDLWHAARDAEGRATGAASADGDGGDGTDQGAARSVDGDAERLARARQAGDCVSVNSHRTHETEPPVGSSDVATLPNLSPMAQNAGRVHDIAVIGPKKNGTHGMPRVDSACGVYGGRNVAAIIPSEAESEFVRHNMLVGRASHFRPPATL